MVFADEPTGNLDSRLARRCSRCCARAVDDLGQTVVMVTHDAARPRVADRVVVLVDGGSSATRRAGSPEEVST